MITLKVDRLPLSKVLTELKVQTQIAVIARLDRDPALKLELVRVPFWEALGQIAELAGARVAVEGQILLVDPIPDVIQPVSASGLFRVGMKQLVSSRDLVSGLRSTKAQLEIVPEPQFRSFYVSKRSESFRLLDEKQTPVKLPEQGASKYPASPNLGTEIEIALPVFPRSASRVGQLKGELTVQGTPSLVSFSFDTLDQLKTPQRIQKESATVEVVKVVLKGDPWSIQLDVSYPSGGPQFETHQTWLTHNELFLESKDGKIRRQPTGQAIDRLTDNRAVITYYFADEKGKPRGNAADWKPSGVTPSRLVELKVPFVFKDIPLP